MRWPMSTVRLMPLFLAQMKKVRIRCRVVGPDTRYSSTSGCRQLEAVRLCVLFSQVRNLMVSVISCLAERTGASELTSGPELALILDR